MSPIADHAILLPALLLEETNREGFNRNQAESLEPGVSGDVPSRLRGTDQESTG